MTTQVVRSLYGNVGMDRAECPECGEWAFVINGKMACCDLEVGKPKRKGIQRMSEPEFRRKTPSSDDKARILSEQCHKCFWCKGAFGSVAMRRGARTSRMTKLIPCWDHVEPYAWSANNSALNFVASCSICNGIKSSKMFPDLEDTRTHILKARERKGWVNL